MAWRRLRALLSLLRAHFLFNSISGLKRKRDSLRWLYGSRKTGPNLSQCVVRGQGEPDEPWPFLRSVLKPRNPRMVQRVGFLILFLRLLIGGTAFLMWIAP